MTTCPELQKLAQFVLLQLSRKQAAAITGHMVDCDLCVATVDSLKGGRPPAGRRLPPGVTPAEPEAQLQPSQRAIQAELPATSPSPAWLVIGFALVAALSFVCFSYANEIARFFQRTVLPSHVERLPR